MHENQVKANRAFAEAQQRDWANLIIGQPNSMFEKACVRAIEDDPRIKVIALSIREMTKYDSTAANLYFMPNFPVLMFRFKCPCGDTITEIMALGNDWEIRLPELLEGLSKRTYKHLQSEGFVV